MTRGEDFVNHAYARRQQAEDNGPEPPKNPKLELLRSKVLSFEELKHLPLPEWRIGGVLPEEGLAVLYGHPGAYKSFVALDWALRIATGSAWLGREVLPGRVLYVITESPAGMGLRAQAWEEFNQHTPESIWFLPMAVNLLETGWVHALVALAEEFGAELIIIDTLSRVIVGGNENSPETMTQLVDAADRLRREHGATLLVHHKPREGANPRGHTALEGAVDTKIDVERKEGKIVLHCRKAKNASEFADIWLEPRAVELDGMPDSLRSSLVLEGAEPEWTATRSEDRIVHQLSTVYPLTGAMPSDLTRDLDMPKSTFWKYTNRLLEKGVIDKNKAGRLFLRDVTE